jgi:hypothetical protein
VIAGLTSGFTLAMWTDLLRVMPALLVAVVAVVLLTSIGRASTGRTSTSARTPGQRPFDTGSRIATHST